MDCHSFFHRSGYRETEAQKEDDFNFLSKYDQGHAAITNQLCLEILTRAPGIQKVLEIGYGKGWFLKACKDYGLEAFGFDVNRFCHDYATDTLHLKCALGEFDESHQEHYDLIVAINVFEHLENPRSLFGLMASRLNPDGYVYVSVPFLERRHWRYLRTAGTCPGDALPDVFYDNDVHVTHFSSEGLRRLGVSMGAREAKFFVSQDPYEKSPGSYPGILFGF